LPAKRGFSCKRHLNALKRILRQGRDRLLGQWHEQRWQREREYIYFQKFLPGNEFTTRVTVIGNRAFGFIICNAKEDFRAYDMQLIDHSPRCLNLDCIRIAFDISKTLGFQCMSYDFLFGEGGEPLVCEMGYTAQAHDIFKCKGFYDQDEIWHEGHYWPQYCQLLDLLEDGFQQPEIDFQTLHWE
jgi:glutathione synthase/RimK-type ligase-like ATP-grasp enzyme